MGGGSRCGIRLGFCGTEVNPVHELRGRRCDKEDGCVVGQQVETDAIDRCDDISSGCRKVPVLDLQCHTELIGFVRAELWQDDLDQIVQRICWEGVCARRCSGTTLLHPCSRRDSTVRTQHEPELSLREKPPAYDLSPVLSATCAEEVIPSQPHQPIVNRDLETTVCDDLFDDGGLGIRRLRRR